MSSSRSSSGGENYMTDELMKRRLLVDGDGGGDDRRIVLLQKAFLNYCSEDAEEMKSSQKKVIHHLNQAEHSFTKTRFSIFAHEEFKKVDEDLHESVKNEVEKAREKIGSCKKSLGLAREYRKQDQEYKALTKLIQTQPERKETERRKLRLQHELAELEALEKSLEDGLINRKKSMAVVMSAITSLYWSNNEEDLENRRKEEAKAQESEEAILKELAAASMSNKPRALTMESGVKLNPFLASSNPGSPMEQISREILVFQPRNTGNLQSPMDLEKEKYDELSENEM